MSVLDDIVAGVRDDLAARRVAGHRIAELRAALARRRARPRPDARLPAHGHQRHRRGEADAARARARSPRSRTRGAGRGVRARRRARDQRAHRASAASAAAWPTWWRCVRRSTPRCCARTSSSATTSSSRRGWPAPTWRCSSSRRSTDDALRRLHDTARELGLTVLVEVHDEAEAERAVDLGAELIGVNARNLKTLAGR